MNFLSVVEQNRLNSRLAFIANMKSKLIGSHLARDFNANFGSIQIHTSGQIDALEDKLRKWMRKNGVWNG